MIYITRLFAEHVFIIYLRCKKKLNKKKHEILSICYINCCYSIDDDFILQHKLLTSYYLKLSYRENINLSTNVVSSQLL